MSEAVTEVAIVGAGVVGACVALELAHRGVGVTLLERGDALGGGASSGNAGLIVPSHAAPIANPAALREGIRWMLRPGSPFSLRPRPAVAPWLARFAAAALRPGGVDAGARSTRELAAASLELHRVFAERFDTSLEQRGVLNVYESQHTLGAAVAEAADSGLEHRVLDAAGARALEPSLGAGVAGGVLYPAEAHCDPLRFLLAVAGAAAAGGASVRTGVDVRNIRRRDGHVLLETSDGELRADQVVLAGGVWSRQLARRAAVFLPLEGGRGYHVELEAAASDPAVPVFLQEARVVATPLPGRLRLAGTLELAGLAPLAPAVRARRAEALRRAALRGLPGLSGRRVLGTWAGMRPCTPDGLPVIGRPQGFEKLVLATGHAMLGLSLAPITGLLVAQIVAGEHVGRDLEPFDPNRFTRWPRGLRLRQDLDSV